MPTLRRVGGPHPSSQDQERCSVFQRGGRANVLTTPVAFSVDRFAQEVDPAGLRNVLWPLREGANLRTARERLGISRPATNGGLKIHSSLSGKEDLLPDRATCHLAPTKSGGNESSEEHIDQLQVK